MWCQIILQESSNHSQREVTEIAEAESSPLDKLDFAVNPFNHGTGCALTKVVGDLIHPIG